MSLISLRGRYNERRNFLMTTMQAVDETAIHLLGAASRAELIGCRIDEIFDIRAEELVEPLHGSRRELQAVRHAQLGRRFFASLDYRAPVTATAHSPPSTTSPRVIRFAAAEAPKSPLTLEELAIPAALRRIFEEVITTAALPVRLGELDWSTHAARYPDAAAVDFRAINRTQIFAAFGDDGARGTLEMVNGWETWDWDGAITVAWPGAGNEAVYRLQDRLLRFDAGGGGLYLRSPLWRPLPEALSAALSGPSAVVASPGGAPASTSPESFSTSSTFRPRFRSIIAADEPPGPPPATSTSTIWPDALIAMSRAQACRRGRDRARD